MNQVFVDNMRAGLDDLGIRLSDRQMEQFYRYYEILTEWNQVMNLTAITEMKEVVEKHFLDSLTLVKIFAESGVPLGSGFPLESSAPLESDFSSKSGFPAGALSSSLSIIDVGTGAGFPGIPLKIAFPDCKVVLLDSLGKRVRFLAAVIEALGLEKIDAYHGRAEDFGHDGSFREQFDLCVSRAVANTAILAEYCIPFVKVGGLFVAYKSGKIEEELAAGEKAVNILGARIDKQVKFQLAGTNADRTLVVIRKEKSTGKKYPRKAGLPGKEPLK